MKKKLLTLAIALTAVIAAALFCQQTAYAADTRYPGHGGHV